ncbi:polygalacturonase-like [Dorcoceras hygrometricum]|uniref:Polygalacturonase-like n=1 Tax=Dorcoceras hygrometricum TaxID=472368 RepID=A0A2Z7BFF1_9LAMI|nr:polygalacturonase-like [Dorcoceras hygrometricum]
MKSVTLADVLALFPPLHKRVPPLVLGVLVVVSCIPHRWLEISVYKLANFLVQACRGKKESGRGPDSGDISRKIWPQCDGVSVEKWRPHGGVSVSLVGAGREECGERDFLEAVGGVDVGLVVKDGDSCVGIVGGNGGLNGGGEGVGGGGEVEGVNGGVLEGEVWFSWAEDEVYCEDKKEDEEDEGEYSGKEAAAELFPAGIVVAGLFVRHDAVAVLGCVMPTVIVFEYDGEWKSNNDETSVFKRCSRSGCKWTAIPVDSEICSVEYIQTEMYKIMGLVGTERLRISYVPNVRHWHVRPIYIENDNDLKAYLYFGCPKDMLVLHVEVEPSIIFEVGMDTRAVDIVGSAELLVIPLILVWDRFIHVPLRLWNPVRSRSLSVKSLGTRHHSPPSFEPRTSQILTETMDGGNVTDYCYNEYLTEILSLLKMFLSEYANNVSSFLNNVTEQENDVENVGVGAVHLDDVEHIVTQPDKFNVGLVLIHFRSLMVLTCTSVRSSKARLACKGVI